MKFSFNKKKVLDALAGIQGITGRKTNLAITSDILIKAMGSGIAITANDLEIIFTGFYEAEVQTEGIICINSRKFFEIVKEYPDDDIIISEIENRWIEIGTGNCQFHIVSSDYENFPATPLIEDIDFIKINAEEFRKMIDTSSIIGYSGDEKRVYVRGSLIEKIIIREGEEKIRIVSTDSKRLNAYDADFTGKFELPETGIIVPKKGFSELSKFIESKSDTIQVGIKNQHFIVQLDNESIMIKLLDGEYPAYKPVLDTSAIKPISINQATIYSLIKRVSILTSDTYKSVIMTFSENELVVSITNPEIGESMERLQIEYSGEKIKGAFNPKFFRDALSLFDKSSVLLFYIDNGESPCIIKNIADDQLVCVIMAMHIS